MKTDYVVYSYLEGIDFLIKPDSLSGVSDRMTSPCQGKAMLDKVVSKLLKRGHTVTIRRGKYQCN